MPEHGPDLALDIDLVRYPTDILARDIELAVRLDDRAWLALLLGEWDGQNKQDTPTRIFDSTDCFAIMNSVRRNLEKEVANGNE